MKFMHIKKTTPSMQRLPVSRINRERTIIQMTNGAHPVDQVVSFNRYCVGIKTVNLLALSQIFVFELAQKRLEGKDRISRVKKFSLDNYVKAFLSMFTLKGKDQKTDSEVLFVNEVYNASMVENLRAVEKMFPGDYTELIVDKRLAGCHSIFLYRYFNPFRYIRYLTKGLKSFNRQALEIKTLCLEFGIKKSLLTLNLLDSLFVLTCAEGFLNAHKEIKNIVLNTDVHKVSKAVVLLAKTRGVKSYVIQHGATVLEYGYLPVQADFMITWGELSRKWFIERGTAPEKLVVLGTPKMDGFQNFETRDEELTRVRNILLILNPIGPDKVRHMLETVREAGLHTDYNLQVKLHPGSVDNRDIVEAVFDGFEIAILKNENTHSLIQHCDVVITTTSTVGNEAIAFNKPLIQYVVPDVQVSMEYEKFGCSHLVRNAEQLKTLIESPERLVSKKSKYPEFLKAYFYRLDGNAALRISEFIREKQGQ